MKLLEQIREEMSRLGDPSLVVVSYQDWHDIRQHMESLGLIRVVEGATGRTLLGVRVELDDEWTGPRCMSAVEATAYLAMRHVKKTFPSGTEWRGGVVKTPAPYRVGSVSGEQVVPITKTKRG